MPGRGVVWRKVTTPCGLPCMLDACRRVCVSARVCACASGVVVVVVDVGCGVGVVAVGVVVVAVVVEYGFPRRSNCCV